MDLSFLSGDCFIYNQEGHFGSNAQSNSSDSQVNWPQSTYVAQSGAFEVVGSVPRSQTHTSAKEIAVAGLPVVVPASSLLGDWPGRSGVNLAQTSTHGKVYTNGLQLICPLCLLNLLHSRLTLVILTLCLCGETTNLC